MTCPAEDPISEARAQRNMGRLANLNDMLDKTLVLMNGFDPIEVIFKFALLKNGYHDLPDVDSVRARAMESFKEIGRWNGSATELRGVLFMEQRCWRWQGEQPEREDAETIISLFEAIQELIGNGEFAPNTVRPEYDFQGVDADCMGQHVIDIMPKTRKVARIVVVDSSGYVVRCHKNDLLPFTEREAN